MNLKYKSKHDKNKIEDVDVTSFMNLMIVLVPVLLLSMTFTQTTLLELKLPDLTGGTGVSADPQAKLEVEITDSGFHVYYPETTLIQHIPMLESDYGADYDYEQLSLVIQAMKQQLTDKRDILLRSELNIDYQSIVATMDVLKSYKTVVAASVVEIELFPEISLDDARGVIKPQGVKSN